MASFLRKGPFFYTHLQFAAKIAKNIKCTFAGSYEKNAIFFNFFLYNIWSVRKKAVLLHPLSPKKRVTPFRTQALIFERMSIHNKM